MKKYFDHEKLDVYKAAIEMIVLIDEKKYHMGRQFLIRIVAMLTEMAQV